MQIKGSILIARLAYVRERFGESALKEVLRDLPDQDRDLLEGSLTNIAWHPFEVGKRLDEAIVRVLGKGNAQVFEDMGAASARVNLRGVHQLFLAPDDPQAFMARAHIIYRSYYDKGRREYQATSPTSGIMTTYDAETYSSFDCMTVVGWYKEALAMCGAKDVLMVEEVCRANGSAFCRYVVSWSSAS